MKPPTTEEKILVHLSRFPHGSYGEGDAPYAITQFGIADSIGASRNYVAVVLGRIERAHKGYIFSETRRVKGFPKKRKVYFLTEKGMKEAKQIIEKWKNEKVKISVGGKIIETKLKDIGEYIKCDNCVYFGLIRMNEKRIIVQKIESENREPIFVGREKEIKKFKNDLENMARGRGGCIFITGEAGMGKTTLALKFGELTKKKGFLFLHGRGYPNLSSPYLPIEEMLKSREVTIKNRNKILGMIKKVGSLPEGANESLKYIRMSIWHDLIDEVEKISREKPMVIFIDDLQWVDLTSLNLLYFICSHIRALNILIIAAYRSDGENEILSGIKNNLLRDKIMTYIKLSSLGYQDIHDMVTRMLGGNIPQNFSKYIMRITGGNPLFIVELINNMNEEGILNVAEGKYPTDITSLKIPDTIEGIINERVKSLDENAQRILQISSVIGFNIPYALLKKISGISDAKMLEALNILMNGDMLTLSSSDILSFAHPLIAMVVYQNMHEGVRTLYHRMVAESAEKMLKKERYTENLIDMGYHYEMGGEPLKAIDYYFTRALHARDIYAYEDSIKLLNRALKLSIKIGDKKRIEKIATELGDTYHKKGEYQNAKDMYLVAIEHAGREELQKLYFKLAVVYREMGNLKDVMESIEQGSSFESSSDFRVRLLSEKIWVLMKMGKLNDAEETLKKMEKLAEEINDPRARALVMENKATLLYYKGRYDEAIEYLKKAIVYQEKSEDRYYLSVLYTNLGILLAQTGHLGDAVKYFDRSKRIEEMYNTRYGLAQVNTNLGIVHYKRGRLKKSLNYFTKAQEIYEKIESFDSLAVSYVNMGNVLTEQGQFEKAIEYLKKAEEIFTQNSDLWGLCHAYLSMADAYTHLKLYRKAEEYLEKTLRVANDINNRGCALESEVMLLRIEIGSKMKGVQEQMQKIEKYGDLLDPELSARVDYIMGLYYFRIGSYEEAEKRFSSSYNKYREYGELFNMAMVECAWARLLGKMGKREKMMKMENRALKYFKSENIEYLADECIKYVTENNKDR